MMNHGNVEGENIKNEITASIIMPVFNNLELTKNCVISLIQNTITESYEVIIINNGSTDNTIDFLESIGGSIKIINNQEKKPLSYTLNQGAAVAEGKYLVFLNNEIIVQSEWLDSLLFFAEDHPGVGIIGSKVLDSNEELFEAGGVVYSNGELRHIGKCGGYAKEKQFIPHEVDFCSLFGMLIQHSLWNEISGTDNSINSVDYLSADLCFKARKVGYSTYYNPSSVIKNVGVFSDSSSNDNSLKNERIKFVKKWEIDLQTRTSKFSSKKRNLQTSRKEIEGSGRQESLDAIYEDENKYQSEEGSRSLKVLSYFPYSLLPIRSGFHIRAFDILSELSKRGFEVVVVSTTLFTDTPWTQDMALELFHKYGVKTVVHRGSDEDVTYITSQKDNLIRNIPPSLKDFFTSIYDQINPDIVLVNMANNAALMDFNNFSDSLNIIDMYALVTANEKMQMQVAEHLGRRPFNTNVVIEDLLREDYFKNKDLLPDKSEISVYDKFDLTLAMLNAEAEIVRLATKKTKVFTLPQIFIPKMLNSNYLGSPVFVMDNSSLCVQGYLYFVDKVLPIIIEEIPDFKLRVIGHITNDLAPVPGVELVKTVSEFNDVYKAAPYAVSPVMGGVAQQLIISEAMSYGVPVVAIEGVSKIENLDHNNNGYLVKNAVEFADYCIKLYKDRFLCQKLGNNAKTKTSELYSEKQDYYDKLVHVIKNTLNRKKINENLEKVSEANKETAKEIRLCVSEKPLVSIILPISSKEENFQATLQSIIDQTHVNKEIIVVNNGMSESAFNKVKEIFSKENNEKYRIYNNNDGETASAINLGFKMATGTYLMKLDTNTILSSNYISKGISLIEQESANLYFSNVEFTGKEGEWVPSDYNPLLIRYDNCLSPYSMFHKSFFEKSGGFKEGFGTAMDWEFWVNCSRYNIIPTRAAGKLISFDISNIKQINQFINNGHQDTVFQIMIEHDDLYSVNEVLQAHTHISQMDSNLYNQIAESNTRKPNNWYFNFLMGLFAEQKGDFSQALDYYENAYQLSERKNWQPIFRLAILFQYYDQPQEAKGLLNIAQTFRPDVQLYIHDLSTLIREKKELKRNEGQLIY